MNNGESGQGRVRLVLVAEARPTGPRGGLHNVSARDFPQELAVLTPYCVRS